MFIAETKEPGQSKLRGIQVYCGLVLDIVPFVLQCKGTDFVSPRIIKPLEAVIMWQKPTAIEMSCGCEINMYAPAEGDRPLF